LKDVRGRIEAGVACNQQGHGVLLPGIRPAWLRETRRPANSPPQEVR